MVVPGITIDPPFAKDLDDAVWVERTDSGYLLHVSIADVSGEILPGSKLDMRARGLGASMYLPHKTNHMLPDYLAGNRLSLMPHKKRKVIAVTIPITKDLVIGKPKVRRTILTSRAKLSYDYVDMALKDARHDFHRELSLFYELASALLARRRANGALVIHDLFNRWTTTEEGHLRKLKGYEAHKSHIIVQEFMILTNEIIAQTLAEAGIPTLFRNHKARPACPDRKSIMEDLDDSVENPEAFRVETLRNKVRMVLERATYGPALQGHYGLNLASYTHFTSPIRRYADIVVHRTLMSLMDGKEPPYAQEELVVIGKEITEKQWEIKDKVNDHYKSEAKKTAAAIGSPSRLDGRDFNRAMMMALMAVDPPADVVKEIERRLDEGGFIARDIYYLLVDANETKVAVWGGIKKKVITWLAKNPHDATATMTMALQQEKGVFKSFSVGSEQKPGTDMSRPIFVGSASVCYRGKDFKVTGYEAISKKLAEQGVVALLWRKIIVSDNKIKIPLEPMMAILSKRTEAQDVSRRQSTMNFKGALYEICMKQDWDQPTYSLQTVEKGGTKSFVALATVVVGDKNHSADSRVPFMRKVDAEQEASKHLLAILKKLVPADNAKSNWAVTADAGNMVAALQQLCVASRLSFPSYVDTQEGPSHTPVITMTCTVKMGDQDISMTAQAGNKKVAKQMAAKLVYAAVSEKMENV